MLSEEASVTKIAVFETQAGSGSVSDLTMTWKNTIQCLQGPIESRSWSWRVFSMKNVL